MLSMYMFRLHAFFFVFSEVFFAILAAAPLQECQDGQEG